jgi:hypothetical protein
MPILIVDGKKIEFKEDVRIIVGNLIWEEEESHPKGGTYLAEKEVDIEYKFNGEGVCIEIHGTGIDTWKLYQEEVDEWHEGLYGKQS